MVLGSTLILTRHFSNRKSAIQSLCQTLVSHSCHLSLSTTLDKSVSRTLSNSTSSLTWYVIFAVKARRSNSHLLAVEPLDRHVNVSPSLRPNPSSLPPEGMELPSWCRRDCRSTPLGMGRSIFPPQCLPRSHRAPFLLNGSFL
jgi:hypothetical protein